MKTTNARERVSRLAGLLSREREALAEFISELADFDLRRCWEERGYASLFEFLVRELRLSRGNAFYRTKAVDLVQRFPETLEALREGKLCVSCTPEVARVLTPENRSEVLPRFFHLSREDAKFLSAEIAPREVVPVRDVVTAASGSRMATLDAPVLALAPAPSLAKALAPAAPVQLLNRNDPKALDRTGQHRMTVPQTSEPMTGSLSRLHLTVTRELLAKIEAAQLALSHAHPGATIADILELGADTALERDARRKGLVKRPGPNGRATTTPDSDHIPAAMRREVWKRDGGCCQWKLANGETCGSRYRVQFDHIRPKAKGGATTVANLRLLRQRHNLLAARMAFGDRLMQRYQRRRAPGASRRFPSSPPRSARPTTFARASTSNAGTTMAGTGSRPCSPRTPAATGSGHDRGPHR